MIKSKLLFAILASTFAFAGCAKDDKKGDTTAKTTGTEATAVDTTVPTAPATPDTAEPVKDEAAAPAAAGEMTREEAGEKAIAMFAELNAIVKATKSDCPQMATDVTAFVEKSKPLMEAMQKFDENPEDKQWFDDTYGEKLKGTMGEMMGNMSECMKDPAVQAAFESMS